MPALLQQIEQSSIFSWIPASGYAYPALLWLHLIAVSAWAGLMLMTNLTSLGWGSWNAAASRRLKWITFLVAALCGVLLFGAKADQYAYNPWFWVKLFLLALLGANSFIPVRQTKLAAAFSLALWMGAVLAARGPATVRDLMHSVVDPAATYLFESVLTIVDERGTTEIAPQTDEEWRQVRVRAETLLAIPETLTAPGRRAARPRDRAETPEVELETAQLQAMMQTKHDDFALRARQLRDAATVVLQAVEAKDKAALLDSLNGLDHACEGCHVRYWYPNDRQAVQAAREAGILE
jgi:hypothetical protein